MPPDHAALLAAILADPGDDLARLVFADYLEESGHPANTARAAFIRAQIEANARPAPGPECQRLTRVAAELRAQFRDEADAILGAPPGAGVFATRGRGFVRELRGSALSLRGVAAALFQVAPVTSLHLDDFGAPHTHWLRSAIYLRGVAALKLGPAAWPAGHSFRREPTGQAVPIEAEALLACAHFRNVTVLDLSANRIADPWLLWFLPRLADAPLGQSLVELDLSRNDLGDHAASLLGSARVSERLSRLAVGENRISDAGLRTLRHALGAKVVG